MGTQRHAAEDFKELIGPKKSKQNFERYLTGQSQMGLGTLTREEPVDTVNRKYNIRIWPSFYHWNSLGNRPTRREDRLCGQREYGRKDTKTYVWVMFCLITTNDDSPMASGPTFEKIKYVLSTDSFWYVSSIPILFIALGF